MVGEGAPREHIDATGLKCPEPVMLLHAAMRRLSPGDELTLDATDPSTERDVPNFCEFLGHSLLLAERHDSVFHYRIQKSQGEK